MKKYLKNNSSHFTYPTDTFTMSFQLKFVECIFANIKNLVKIELFPTNTNIILFISWMFFMHEPTYLKLSYLVCNHI